MRTGNSEPEENVEPAAKRRKVKKNNRLLYIDCKLTFVTQHTHTNLKFCFVLKNLYKLLF